MTAPQNPFTHSAGLEPGPVVVAEAAGAVVFLVCWASRASPPDSHAVNAKLTAKQVARKTVDRDIVGSPDRCVDVVALLIGGPAAVLPTHHFASA
ncbi:hypothetical protein GCM10027521_54060 [Amycolatopsis cihanbeyliensis]